MSKEQTNKKDIWNPCFHKNFAGFECLLLWEYFQSQFTENWLTIEDFNYIAQHCYQSNALDKPYQVRFIEQAALMQYETKIYQESHVPSRLHNWHDFFNNLTWLTFPKTKWALIHKNISAKGDNPSSRTSLQNTLAHFDECGMVFCSDQKALFENVHQYQWKSVFWETKDLLSHGFPLIIGHGLLEKALSPYLGMTGKAIFLKVQTEFFHYSLAEKLIFVDKALAQFILSEDFPHLPSGLHPFPLLGWPHWHPHNRNEVFYENKHYFRTTRNKTTACQIVVT